MFPQLVIDVVSLLQVIFHSFCPCPSLLYFWTSVLDTLSELTGQQVTPALFGVYPLLPFLGKYKRVIYFTTLLARRQILMIRKQTTPHYGDILHFNNREKCVFFLSGNSNSCNVIWGDFFLYIKTNKLDPSLT